MPRLKLIPGQRRQLELQFLTALFTPGGNVTAEVLKKRLTPAAKGRLRAVGTSSSSTPSEPPPSS